MYLLGKAYVKVKMQARAKEIWTELVKTYPTREEAHKAQSALSALKGEPGPRTTDARRS